MSDVGVDQVIFIQQAGRNRHDDICASLELFAAEVLPEFAAHEPERQARKHAELEPYVADGTRPQAVDAAARRGRDPDGPGCRRPGADGRPPGVMNCLR